MNTGIQDAAIWDGSLLSQTVLTMRSSTLTRRNAARSPAMWWDSPGFAFALEVSDFLALRWARRLGSASNCSSIDDPPQLAVEGRPVRVRAGYLLPQWCHELRWGRAAAILAGRRFPDAKIVGHAVSRLHDVIDATAFHLVVFGGTLQEAALEGLRERHWEALRIHRLDGSRLKGGRPRVSHTLVRSDGYIAASGTDGRLRASRSS